MCHGYLGTFPHEVPRHGSAGKTPHVLPSRCLDEGLGRPKAGGVPAGVCRGTDRRAEIVAVQSGEVFGYYWGVGGIMMRVLVVGNGFDLAHYLPTKYTDFLKVAESAQKDFIQNDDDDVATEQQNKKRKGLLGQSISNKNLLQKAIMSVVIKFRDYFINHISGEWKSGNIPKPGTIDHDELTNRILQLFDKKTEELNPYNLAWKSLLLEKNIWLQYFLERYDDVKERDGWIDFEAEIGKIIKDIEKRAGNRKDVQELYEKPLHGIGLLPEEFEKIYDRNKKEIFRNQSIKDLEERLKEFALALEFYLIILDHIFDVYEGFPKVRYPVVSNGAFDKLLSFNYTHTYEQYYRDGASLGDNDKEYIHGECRKNNLILGIDDGLSEGEKDEKKLCKAFKKCFQRDFYGTGMKYKEWFSSTKDKCEVFIFGHSLDVTDKDVLAYIIKHAKKVTVFYRDENSHRKQTTNLVKILGQDNLIKWTGNGHVEFREQGEPQEV